MRKQDFYGLPRAIQDRFIESSQGAAAPVPLAVYPRSETQSLVWWTLSLVCVLGWAGFTSLGIGDLYSAFALSSPLHTTLHVVFASAAVFFALRAYAVTWAMGRLPYATGDYLYPSGVISASFGQLAEFDSREIQAVEPRGDKIIVRYTGRTFTFLGETPERARDVADMFGHSREAWRGVADGEPLDRARLHPLTDSGIPNPLAPTDPHERPRFFSVPVLAVAAVVLGMCMGLGVSAWRDSLSQKALYRRAIAEDTVQGYQAYLERGGERADVKTLLLPRAELRLAIAKGTVGAVQEFKERHADTQITGEVQNALRAALLRELEKAKANGSLRALSEFPKKFPSYGLIAGELAAAKQAVYAKAMSDFQAQASSQDPDLIPFVQRLLTYAQTHGPDVELRFHQEFPQDRENIDQIVSKAKKYYMGTKSLPSQYVLGERARVREKRVLTQIKERLQRAFPEDILRFRLGPEPKEANEAPPPPSVPTITFMHRSMLSGGYVGGAPKAMYMGVALHMTSQAHLPGEAEPYLEYKWNAWRHPKFSILVDTDKDIPDIYAEMIDGAFDKYAELYLGLWFESP